LFCLSFERFRLGLNFLTTSLPTASTPGSKVTKLFISVNYEVSKSDRVFVPDRPVQPSLMFVGKASSLS
jgi:hypothetical protein